ncbi:dTTP/UTP pyrophosphatase-like [Chrysoperla carnea]|uniref:dTTP/UTP pyrophosphatase-like n=1 Tax=Chrysoperla carnea TaxID=189513 RepID=UPI001D0680A7|nr:dTTP/UTP pyrophosphatase-like [Chrysoperla carnea]
MAIDNAGEAELDVPWNKMVLKPIIEELNQNRVVLASRSPSRKELLQLMGFKNLDIIPSSYDENLDSKLYSNFDDYVQELALQKILDVERTIKAKNEKAPVMILGSDTIVTLNGKVYGKPQDKKDAFLKLKSLSGKTNVVYTGVAVKLNGKIHKFSDSTRVQFDNLSDERIWEYIETGEPMDKAGGYAIQGFGSTLVEKIDGNIHTVAGFPLFKFTKWLLQQFHSEPL